MTPRIAEGIPIDTLSLQSLAELGFVAGKLGRGFGIFEEGAINGFRKLQKVGRADGSDGKIVIRFWIEGVPRTEFSVRACAGNFDRETIAVDGKFETVGSAPRVDERRERSAGLFAGEFQRSFIANETSSFGLICV